MSSRLNHILFLSFGRFKRDSCRSPNSGFGVPSCLTLSYIVLLQKVINGLGGVKQQLKTKYSEPLIVGRTAYTHASYYSSYFTQIRRVILLTSRQYLTRQGRYRLLLAGRLCFSADTTMRLGFRKATLLLMILNPIPGLAKVVFSSRIKYFMLVVCFDRLLRTHYRLHLLSMLQRVVFML